MFFPRDHYIYIIYFLFLDFSLKTELVEMQSIVYVKKKIKKVVLSTCGGMHCIVCQAKWVEKKCELNNRETVEKPTCNDGITVFLYYIFYYVFFFL